MNLWRSNLDRSAPSKDGGAGLRPGSQNFRAGDIVEFERGRWKGRRLIVLGMTGLGCVDTKDGNGRVATIISAQNLKLVRSIGDRTIARWLRVWHRANDETKNVMRNAFRMRRLHKKYYYAPRLEKTEWFLSEFLKFSEGL